MYQSAMALGSLAQMPTWSKPSIFMFCVPLSVILFSGSFSVYRVYFSSSMAKSTRRVTVSTAVTTMRMGSPSR